MPIPVILSGSTTANGGIILTVPANSYWSGDIFLSAAVAGGNKSISSAKITIQGVGSNPPPGDYLQLNMVAQADIVNSPGSGAGDSASVLARLGITTSDTPVSLILNSFNTSSQSASAIAYQ